MKTAIAQISQISPKKELLQNRLVITGLEGKKPLAGTIRISGAKNAALKAMAAAVLFDGPVTLENVPDTADIHTLAEILIRLGAKVAFEKDHTFTVTIDPTTIAGTAIDAESAKTMRGSVVLTGPLLARFGRATFPAPGGCVIGARPIDLFLEGYKKMGAAVSENGQYDIEAASGLAGAEISFEKISVGATETLMMAAVLARGTTTLKNCAMEPEIVNVAEWLNSCGADIRGAGTPTITIVGTAGKLLKPSASYVTIPDRIEAGSYLFLGALCASELVIENCRPDHLQAPIELLKKAGVPIETTADSI
ncbi:MAG: UDP-N-acetylglucosamine 1-carboxyvinyltransferase, partial [Patescibacteria group bacterium]|nr:UDP-N-acetylglucosamine 1-carboxyvinyltransferase [Patescibacteria group bacterium]